MILINTTNQNIWVRQPLLAAELFEAEVHPKHCAEKDREVDEIIISFQLLPACERQEHIKSNVVEVEVKQDEQQKRLLQWITQSLGRVQTPRSL